MLTALYAIDSLLDPISADQPCGKDLRWTAEWDRIKEARRADDGFDPGKWAKKERKAANWRLAEELTTTILQSQSKDLQIAMWFTEAKLQQNGLAGLRDGLCLVRELITRYWNAGLFPPIEEGPEDRAGPIAWLNDKLVDSIARLPITARSNDENYSYLDLQDARRVGSAAGYTTPDGDIDDVKKKAYDTALANGHISVEMFQRAFQETETSAYEGLYSDFKGAYEEFKALEKAVDATFGDRAPNLSDCRAIFSELDQEISDLMEKKRPAASSPGKPGVSNNSDGRGDEATVRLPVSALHLNETPESRSAPGGSWQEAERLVRTGKVDAGLAEMTRLAATETTGRSRFQRRLLLAEACLASSRDGLARAILEELAEQIDKFQLELWESSELIGSVWKRLYALYKRSDSADPDRARQLYDRLCRLDPWQALACTD